MLKKLIFIFGNKELFFRKLRLLGAILAILCFSSQFIKSEVIKKGDVISFSDIIFSPNSDKIKEKSLPILDEIAKVLIDRKYMTVQMNGHTNSIGNTKAELKLSVKRAKKVALYLTNKGVDPRQINTVGHGGLKLKNNRICESNRRVEIKEIRSASNEANESNKRVKIQPSPTKIEKRTLKIITGDNSNASVIQVEIKKRERGKVVYSKKVFLNQVGIIDVPVGNVELIVTADEYIPQKVVFDTSDKNKNIALERIEKNKKFIVKNLYFVINQSYLKMESFDILDEFVKFIKRNPNLKVEVRGYTDNTNYKELYNIALSKKRASTVVKYLIKNGISEKRLTAKGFGANTPIASNDTVSGRKKNRRTEFYLN